MTNTTITRNDTALKSLAQALLSTFNEIESKRGLQEEGWLQNLRQVKGVYDPTILSRIPAESSKVYPKFTKSKERYIRSKINSIIFPETGKSWSIRPTPKPAINEEIIQQVQMMYQQALQQGKQLNQEDVDAIISKIVNLRCKEMESTINDQLLEANYEQVYKKVIKSGIIYGTGIWKGPMTTRKTFNNVMLENGVVFTKEKVIYKPTLKHIPIWYWYPDMSVAEIDQCSYIFELHVMSKKEILELTKQVGFFNKNIKSYLSEHPYGDYIPKNWETTLRTIKDKEMNDLNMVDRPTVKSYQVLEGWGFIDGIYFKQAGLDNVSNLDDNSVYEARFWLLGDEMIKLSLNPLPYGAHPYNVFYYDKDETSIFGTGLPEDIRGSQEVICAASRMLLDNAAIVAGPQMEINLDLLDPDQDVSNVHSRKMWYRTGIGVEAQYPAIRSIGLDSHIQEYSTILEIFRKIGDEESSIPSVLWNNLQQGEETAKSALIRYQTAHISLMDIIKEFDTANEKFIRSMYKWNMEFNENPEIKGDYYVEARGTDTLLEKETKLEAILTFMQTLTPDDLPYIKRRSLLEERLKLFNMDYSNILNTESEAQAIIAQNQQIQQYNMQLSSAKLQAETEYEKAKAANMFAKAKKTLADEDLDRKEFARGLINDEADRRADTFKTLFGEETKRRNNQGITSGVEK